MDDIKMRLEAVKNRIAEAALSCGRKPEEITLVAVSKKKSSETVIEAIKAGVDILGENYIQEAVDKIDSIRDSESFRLSNGNPKNSFPDKKEGCSGGSVSWHFIGHLQSNKAKVAVRYFELIHSVDSLKLAEEIDRQAAKAGKIQDILIQINISQEESKSGTAEEDAVDLARSISGLRSVKLKGVMGMPPFFDDSERARPYLRKLASIHESIKREKIPGVEMDILSMGMSDDFRVAIEEGSTMVRIGTAIFGSRQ